MSGAPLALTPGEPAGIGPELALQAWLALRASGPAFFLIDDPARVSRLAERIGLAVPVRVVDDAAAVAVVFPDALPILREPLAAEVALGRPRAETGAWVIRAIERAVALVATGQAAAVVTNPIQKEALYAAGFRHPGHTEFLAELAGGATPVMMLACPELRVVPVTIHVPIAEVPRRLSKDMIVTAGRITAAALVRDFGIARPRLAVAGLNPHAGEGGTIGREEIDIVGPAVEALRRDGLEVLGPASADSLFHAEARARYDAALCMYHDQALIPLKTLDFYGGVNVTLGLPFVRTSPDHGTALDLAGSGRANPRSLEQALRLAAEMAARRAAA